MRTIIVTAKFKGPEWHQGYEPGQIYGIEVGTPGLLDRLLLGYKKTWRLIITRPNFSTYSTRRRFEQNWEIIDHQEQLI